MEIQNFINNMNETLKILSGKEYNLGNLIDDLKQYKDDFLEVEFDDGTIPTDFMSWRGSYCELALGYKFEGICHISELFRKAFNSNGSIYVGYKGGDFTMDLDTPIHQANYGEVSVYNKQEEDQGDKKLIGIKKAGNKIIIITRSDED
jgi:hypothetical protein